MLLQPLEKPNTLNFFLISFCIYRPCCSFLYWYFENYNYAYSKLCIIFHCLTYSAQNTYDRFCVAIVVMASMCVKRKNSVYHFILSAHWISLYYCQYRLNITSFWTLPFRLTQNININFGIPHLSRRIANFNFG